MTRLKGACTSWAARAASICALQKHDAEAAYEAAVACLTRRGHDRHFSPALILEIDGERGLQLLCSQLVREKNRLVPRSICVALRHCHRQSAIEQQVSSLLKGDAEERYAAAEIMQWMGPSFLPDSLLQHLLKETIEYVQYAFLSAVAAHKREIEASRILSALERATGIDQWRLADAVVSLAEPEQIGRQSYPLWLAPISEGLPPAIQQYVDKNWEEAQKQIQRDLEKAWDE